MRDEIKMPFYAFIFFIGCMAWTIGSMFSLVGIQFLR
jgi:hypothetical protein